VKWEKKEMIKHIPNMLSFLRIPVSIAMPFLGRNYMRWFFVCFVIAGLTDVFDGVIARKFNLCSKFGEKIDSLADGIFISCLILTGVLAIRFTITSYHWGIFAVLMAIRAMNMAFTWKKFRRVGFIHTRSTRWAAIPMYILVPISVYLGDVPSIPLAIFLVLTTIAQLEETYILHKMQCGEYTMSLKSYWQWKRDRDAINAALQEANPKELLTTNH
jgi:CDP-diacylglycerol--glycerol-3-phosphate 3-phosphatidyltransferase